MTTLQASVEELYRAAQRWPLAANNYANLRRQQTRQLSNGLLAAHNPARIRSTAATIDKQAIAARPCFLCRHNRPGEQDALPWAATHHYELLVNPFPLFHRHLTIVSDDHTPQTIAGRLADLCRLARELPDYTLFFNGARCGASAPDHQHFQAIGTRRLPLIEALTSGASTILSHSARGSVATLNSWPWLCYALRPSGHDNADALLDELTAARHLDLEMVNILCLANQHDATATVLVVPRRAFRPAEYSLPDPERLLVSPAAVEVAGMLVAPRREDFERLDAELANHILDQVCFTASHNS